MPANVLYVDDDRGLCQIVSRALQSEGHSVRTACDGDAALAAIQEECPELVLLDLVLPRKDGFVVLEALRALPAPICDVPVVMVSGATPTLSTKERAQRLGVAEFLTKPVPLERLLTVVSEQAGEVKVRRRHGAPQPAATRTPLRRTRGIAGDLDRIPFPAVLHHLHGMRATGVLHLRSSTRKRKAVALRDGYPVAVKSNLKSETLGDFLERKGRITHAIYEESLSLLSTGRRQGEVLVAMDVLSEEEVAEVLLDQADAKFFEIFRWQRGVFRFERGARLDRSNALRMGASPANLIVEGVRSHFSLQRIDRYLSRQSERLVSHADTPFYRFQELHLDPSQEAILRNLDGTRRLGEFRVENEEFRRTLYGMIAAGFLELSAKVSVAAKEESPRQSSLAERSAATAADVRRDAATQLELEAMAEQLRAKTHFEVLGVEPGSDDDALHAAYAHLSSRLHPDRYVSESQAVRQLAGELHQLVEHAHATLSDPRERQKYAHGQRKEGGASPQQSQGEKALQAELEFRKGEAALRIHDYPGAKVHFGKAVELYPEEGDYYAHYGWALYLSHPNDASMVGEALEHVKRGVKLAGHREKPYLFMGRLYKVVGRIDAAEKMFTRAVQIQPECVEALRELRLINLRRERSKGFIGRLFRR